MTFSELMDLLFEVKRKAPDMTFSPDPQTWGQSVVRINLPVSQEHAELLIQAQKMFAPRDTHQDWTDYQSRDEPPF